MNSKIIKKISLLTVILTLAVIIASPVFALAPEIDQTTNSEINVTTVPQTSTNPTDSSGNIEGNVVAGALNNSMMISIIFLVVFVVIIIAGYWWYKSSKKGTIK